MGQGCLIKFVFMAAGAALITPGVLEWKRDPRPDEIEPFLRRDIIAMKSDFSGSSHVKIEGKVSDEAGLNISVQRPDGEYVPLAEMFGDVNADQMVDEAIEHAHASKLTWREYTGMVVGLTLFGLGVREPMR